MCLVWLLLVGILEVSCSSSLTDFSASGSLPVIDSESIRLLDYIDRGRFSVVYEAEWENRICVMKILKQSSMDVLNTNKIVREIDILERCDDIEGVVNLLGITKNETSPGRNVALIFERVGEQYQWLSHKGRPPTLGPEEANPSLSNKEVKWFMHHLLKTLEKVHRRGIMHRDLKPRNVIIDRSTRKLKLIDFGHADIMLAGKQYSNRVSSRSFKAPELLFDYRCYDSAVDLWACGCLFAGLIFKLEPFFYARPDPLNLGIVTAVARQAGSESILTWAKKWGVRLSDKQRKAIGRHPAVPLKHFRSEENEWLCCDEAIDLCERMLVVDHSERITVEAALQHPYFAEFNQQ